MKAAPRFCIKCKSENLENLEYDGDFHSLWCQVRCGKCGTSWTEYYKFDSIEVEQE